MPYPFVLPTTSSFSFSSAFTCESHPSLPLQASTHRGVVRDTLKKHKRLAPASQGPDLPNVASALQTYIPYLLAIEAGLARKALGGAGNVTVTQTAPPQIEWRPTLASSFLPGRDPPRVKITSLEHEIFFTLSALANTHTLQARFALQPLYLTNTAPVGTTQRQTAVTTATRHLLDAASIYDYLCTRPPSSCPSPSPHHKRPPALRRPDPLGSLRTPLPCPRRGYPSRRPQGRPLPDPRLPGPQQARHGVDVQGPRRASRARAPAAALLSGAGAGSGSAAAELVRYANDVRRTSRARACRFFGVDAELGGETGKGIAWLRAGLQELGVEDGKGSKIGGLKGLKKEWSERREDKKVERGLDWGADGGRLEETRVIEMLEAKWVKQNDTILTQPIPPVGPLLAEIPSGREIHTIKPYESPVLDAAVLEAMRAPPDRPEEVGNYASSDEDTATDSAVPGAFPGRPGEYRTDTPGYY
ncbi:hypothetical protein VTJ83DRAFT_514 [Remersonia thermophila]|uniref:pH-response regulator protein palC n=1 Tax=Remersonia thermophila TaxID=72144 RepID=A0ABR4DLA5_9PEZI